SLLRGRFIVPWHYSFPVAAHCMRRMGLGGLTKQAGDSHPTAQRVTINQNLNRIRLLWEKTRIKRKDLLQLQGNPTLSTRTLCQLVHGVRCCFRITSSMRRWPTSIGSVFPNAWFMPREAEPLALL